MLRPGIYVANDAVYLSDPSSQKPKELHKLVSRLIESDYGQIPLSLIDVGCASGAFILHARSVLNIARCVGLDISTMHLRQAQALLPWAEFINEPIESLDKSKGRMFDICTCLGTMSIFDDTIAILANLLSLVKAGGSLYVADLVNDFPVDVIMRYRRSERGAEWKAGFNVRSQLTYEEAARKIDPRIELRWTDFEMPFAISQTPDPLRVWTIQTEHKPHQQVVGTGQLINFKILSARKLPRSSARLETTRQCESIAGKCPFGTSPQVL